MKQKKGWVKLASLADWGLNQALKWEETNSSIEKTDDTVYSPMIVPLIQKGINNTSRYDQTEWQKKQKHTCSDDSSPSSSIIFFWVVEGEGGRGVYLRFQLSLRALRMLIAMMALDDWWLTEVRVFRHRHSHTQVVGCGIALGGIPGALLLPQTRNTPDLQAHLHSRHLGLSQNTRLKRGAQRKEKIKSLA